MDKILVLLIVALVGLVIVLAVVGHKLVRIIQAIGTSILIIVFAVFLSRIFRPAQSV